MTYIPESEGTVWFVKPLSNIFENLCLSGEAPGQNDGKKCNNTPTFKKGRRLMEL